MSLKKFQLGDEVTWRSQSQGSTTEKTGIVVKVIEDCHRPDAAEFPALFSGAGVGMSRDHESYVVRAGRKLYWPRVSKLSKVGE